MKTTTPLFFLVLLFGCQSNQPSESPPNSIPKDWSQGCSKTDVEFHSVNTGEVNLHVACKGEGPVIILLHGFPEFWYGWYGPMNVLAEHYTVVVPDQRGYNLSDKPPAIEDYVIPKLVEDIKGLMDVVAPDKLAALGAHDWGGPIGWLVAHLYGERIEKLIMVNGPHPNILSRERANNPEQQQASGYMDFFRSPNSEDVLAANDFEVLQGIFQDILTEEEMAIYKEAWGQPDALRSGLNWYRANTGDNESSDSLPDITVQMPTKILWGMKDSALLPGNLVGLEEYVPNLSIQEFPDATHWIIHEEPQAVSAAMLEFLQGE